MHIFALENGDSAFAESKLEGAPRHVVDGLPPLGVAGPFDATGIAFVVQATEATDWQHHVAPRSQWVIILTGRVAITVTGGERREFGPGDVLLIEDTTGAGHLSTPLTDDLTFAMIPTGGG
jgi:quercetin dioxygenase-like cupin family protein